MTTAAAGLQRRRITFVAPTPLARAAFGVVALAGIAGMAISLTLTVTDPGSFPPADRGLFGESDTVGRLADWFSYFTHWSLILVVLVSAHLALRPSAPSRHHRVLLFDALLMISVTGIVYAVVLAPVAPPMEGWELLSNALQHYVTPPLAVLAFIAFGPRRWLERGLIPAALVIPIAWLAFTYARGAIIDAYPYGFINVVELGYPMALVNTLAIVVFGIAICFVLIGIDRVMQRWGPAPV